MNDPRFPRRVIAGVIASLALTSCSLLDPEEVPVPAKNIDKSAQTDPAPVQKRTRDLPEDAEFLWYSGTLGSGAPGPSTYWVDARLSTTDQVMNNFRALCPDGSVSVPDVVDELAQELGEEDYVECPAAAGEIAVDGWRTRVWLAQASPVMVVTLVGLG
ncbi:MAG: hypothetical protein ACTMII_03515 [Brachybacterium sp.]